MYLKIDLAGHYYHWYNKYYMYIYIKRWWCRRGRKWGYLHVGAWGTEAATSVRATKYIIRNIWKINLGSIKYYKIKRYIKNNYKKKKKINLKKKSFFKKLI